MTDLGKFGASLSSFCNQQANKVFLFMQDPYSSYEGQKVVCMAVLSRFSGKFLTHLLFSNSYCFFRLSRLQWQQNIPRKWCSSLSLNDSVLGLQSCSKRERKQLEFCYLDSNLQNCKFSSNRHTQRSGGFCGLQTFLVKLGLYNALYCVKSICYFPLVL